MERKLAAILVADVAGYSRLMEAYETQTHARLMALRGEVIEPAIAAQRGRIVKNTGDGFLATFGSVNDAVDCAIGIQQSIQQRETTEASEQRITFRMGLNIGDLIVEAEDVYGSGVNIASRLQELAEPGGLMISATVRDQIRSDVAVPMVDLGELPLKNLAAPVRTFRVLTAAEQGRPRVSPSRSGGLPSIAVMPFRTLDPNPAKAYFGDGIVEDIVGALAALKELLVISRNSTLAYRSTDFDLNRVGKDLGVRYVLSGTVRRSRSRIRITAELADAENGSILWAQSYNSDTEDLFEVQDRITALIVGTVAPRVRDAEIRRAYLKRPESMDAYDHVLQALDLLYRLDPADFARAGVLLQRAIALDGSYATAHSLMAEWHSLRIGQGWSPKPEVDRSECLRHAQAAVDRDESNVRALALLGHHKSYLDRDFVSALTLFDRAISASPNNPWVWGLSAPTFSYIGDGRTAIARAERALRLSPFDPWVFWYHTSLCVAYYTIGSYEEAVQWGEIVRRERSNYIAGLLPTAASLAALGRETEAQEVARAVLRVDPAFRVEAYAARYPYREVARRELLRDNLLLAGLPA